VVSIPVTALIPLIFFPLLDVMDIKTVAASYAHPIVFLFFGGFVLALALEKVNLHKRVALRIIQSTGTSPNRVIMGFMLATAFLSMWISNTATTVVMLPLAYSVISLLKEGEHKTFTKNDKNFALSLMLGIAYSANVGGIATLIGTPPNIVLAGFMESEYGLSISFLKWMAVGTPFALVMLCLIYLILTQFIFKTTLDTSAKSTRIIRDEAMKLGPLHRSELIVLVIFLVVILLWVCKNSINDLLPNLELSDTTISLLAAFACFAIRTDRKPLLNWEDTKKLPWGIIILFGGGLALAGALSNAQLIDLIGQFVSESNGMGLVLTSLVLIASMLFATELMSNVALVAIFAPMVAGVATGMNQDLLHILVPVTMASSCAFMFPMSTPPNAIVFASGHVKIAQMMKAGVWLNLLAIGMLLLFFKFVIPLFLST